MNINDVNMETQQVPNTAFRFSAARPDDLGALKYTLVTIAVDASGSVKSFVDELVKMLNTAVDALRKSPMAENLLVRVIRFADQVEEIHGFAPLSSIHAYAEADLPCGGMTALIDATLSGIGAMNAYGKQLVDRYYSVNGILFVITDGEENRSMNKDPAVVKAELEKAVRSETIGGVTSLLIGINAAGSRSTLDAFKKEAGIDHFVEVADASPGRLAKLAGLVSRSISSSSQRLAQGGTQPVPVDQLTI